MATKKKATPKAKTEPKPQADEIPAPEEIVENNEEAKVEEPIKEETPEPDSKVPGFLSKSPAEFMVGTKDYRDLVQMSNNLFGTMWNTHRVRPAVFYGIYKKLTDHFAEK